MIFHWFPELVMKKNQSIGFDIIGTGMVAEFHARASENNKSLVARLVAVSTRDPAKFEKNAGQYGVYDTAGLGK